MSDPPPKARGRGKVRTRGPSTTLPERTGDAPGSSAPPGVGPTAMQPSGGRRTHRGAPRTDVPREGDISQVTRQMGAMEMGESAGRGALHRGRDFEITRPANLTDKKGTSGESISLVSNYFELISKPNWAIQQYHVDFAPLVESSYIRKGMIHTHKEALGSCYLFDGMSDLKTLARIPDGTELFTQRRTDNETIRITLKHTGEMGPNHPELLRLFNTQMRRNLQHLKFILLGRHYFDQSAVSEVPHHKLQVWQGVVTSIRQMEERIMMNVDSVHKVVRKESALDIIKEIISKCSSNYKDEVANDLSGAVVMTKYNNRTYRIEDIHWDLNPASTFEAKGGAVIAYKDYYKNQYDITIGDSRQPLLLCTSKEKMMRGDQGRQQQRKIFLVPELCYMTGLTDAMRSNFNMMKDLATNTKLDPQARVRNLKHFIGRVNQNPDVKREMASWGLRFSEDLVRINARIVPGEQIIQRDRKFPYDQKSADFSREVRGNKMHTTVNLDNWVIICTQRDSTLCSDFLANLNRVCPPMGMSVSQPRKVTIMQDRIANYLQAMKENVSKNTSIVVIIVPNNKKDRYDALKKYTCVDFPIPSQVITGKLLMKSKQLMSVATKIGIQMNCKLGGEPWALDIPLKCSIMIIGYDTYHDSSKKGRSAGGFVASLNSVFTRWYSRVNFHQSGAHAELSDYLRENITTALRKFRAVNNSLPALILFYRDGVGDGSIRYVKEHEVNQFENTLRELIPDACKDGKPRSSFIIVNKSINARFFAEQGRDRYINPPPGTIVDNIVTRSDRYDFYLVSQNARQGTVGPTMYNIISDGSGLKPEHQQRLAYKLTHLYFNYQGTVRVPAPCQYAHKLAFLAGQSLHREPAEELSDKLFFL